MLALSIITLFLFTLLETTITTIPLILIVVLIMAVVSKKSWIFSVAFAEGIFLDLLSFDVIGKTSVFFTFFLLILLLYDKKFEIRTVHFVLISSLLGSLFYLILFNYQNSIMQTISSSVIAVILFLVVKRIVKLDSQSKLAI